MLTVDHVFHSLRVIFAQVNDSTLCLSEAASTCALEKGRSGCEKYTVYLVSFGSTNDGQI